MKHLTLLFLALVFAAGSCTAGSVEEFCTKFASGAEVRVYRSFPQAKANRDSLELAKKAECFELLGEVFYPEFKTLNAKDATDWLARATNPDSYYPTAAPSDPKIEPIINADIAFWCVTPDHKNEAYCLMSFSTSQVKVIAISKGVTVAMTIELEKLSREIHQRYFKQELKIEKSVPLK